MVGYDVVGIGPWFDVRVKSTKRAPIRACGTNLFRVGGREVVYIALVVRMDMG
jgi:hypothetical protein